MHRWAVLELSCRHVVDRRASSTPRALNFRRTFRSSPARSNDPRSSANEKKDESASSSTTLKPKFAPKWGSRAPAKPTGLSAAEQALRNNLVANSQPRPKPKPPSKPKPPQQKSPQSQLLPISRYADTKKAAQHAQDAQRARWGQGNVSSQSQRTEGQIALEQNLKARDAQRAGRHQAVSSSQSQRTEGQIALEQNLKARDAQRARRSQGDSSSQSRRTERRPDSEQSLKYRQLGQSYNAEWNLGKQLKRATTSAKDEADSEPRRDGQRSTNTTTVEGQKSDKKANQENQDPWAWDMSALKHLETSEAQSETAKTPKRREGRKQRQLEVERGYFDEESEERRRGERKRLKQKKAAKRNVEKSEPAPLYLPAFITVNNLADVIGVRPAEFVERMEEMGFEDVTYSHVLDAETAGLVAAEFNFEPIFETETDDLEAAPEPEDKSSLPSRPPVVTIMGHVDHGKTTILDWLRKSSIAAAEHGGITQHIGAFSVAMPSGKTITFLDTPGHSAFLEMRRRGANVTDIVVLVVAADDSVKPQTIEAIKHATEGKVPIIVAISKIDKEGRNPDRVKGDLSTHGVHVEDFGGDVQAIPVSGKTGEGMVELEEAIVALSEMLDHRADTTCNAEGWVIEASTKSYGRVASALIRSGTLRPGDIIVAGTTWARARTLRNEAGVAISEATPGMPVEIDGWREQPAAGTEILQAPSEQKAKDVVAYRQEKSETRKMGEDMTAINEARRELAEKRKLEDEGSDQAANTVEEPTGPRPVHFVIKADVDGSAEAVVNSLAAIGNNEVFANILRSGVGPVSGFDVDHAASANGHIISFNMPIDPAIMQAAETQKVKIMDHNIIYRLIDDVKATLSERLAPEVTHRVTGEAEVLQVFEITTKGRAKTSIAGCRVRNGIINKARKVRVFRGDKTIYDGSIASLKNVKKDVTEMRKDTECGIGFENWTEFAIDDHIQCYEEIFEKRYL